MCVHPSPFSYKSCSILIGAVSSKPHSHAHTHTPATTSPSPHAHISPGQRLERILMFLEAQFGECVTPLEPGARPTNLPNEITEMEGVEDEDQDMELERMKRVVPGVQIKIDSMVANVWFETLDVECRNESLRMRIKTVVERAVETVAPFVDLMGSF